MKQKMYKIGAFLVGLIVGLGFVAGFALAAPTSTIVSNLFINAIKPPSGTVCLNINSAGLVSTTTCGGSGSGGGGVVTSSPIFANALPFFIAGGSSSTVITASGLNFVSSTGVLTVPTGTFTNLSVTNLTNSLVLAGSNGNFGLYGGSACSGSDQVISISASGTVICSAQGSGGSGSVTTSSPVTATHFAYWASANGGLNGTSTLLFTSSQLLSSVAFNASGTITTNGVQVSTSTGANPTASIGLSAINGTAGTFLRSDAAQALDVSIAPTWTGLHTWQTTSTFNATTKFASSTASRCARFDANQNLVSATGDCAAGDTTGGSGGGVATSTNVVANRIAFYSNPNTLDGSSNLTYATSTGALILTATTTITNLTITSSTIQQLSDLQGNKYSTSTYTSTSTKTLPIINYTVVPDTSGEVWLGPYSTSSGMTVNGLYPRFVTYFGSSTSTAATSTIGIFGGFTIPNDYVSTPRIQLNWGSATTTGMYAWRFSYFVASSTNTLDATAFKESVQVSSTVPISAHTANSTMLSLTSANFAADAEVEYSLQLAGASSSVNTASSTAILFSALFQYKNQ